MAVPLASLTSASRSLAMTCSGVCRCFLAMMEPLQDVAASLSLRPDSLKGARSLAREAFAFASAFTTIEKAELNVISRSVRREFCYLRLRFDSLIRRWGWKPVTEEGGEVFIENQLRRFQENVRLPFLKAVHAFVEGKIERDESD